AGPSVPLTAGHGREDGDRIALADLRLQRPEVADILLVDIDVHEPVEVPAPGHDAVLDARIAAFQVVQHFADGPAAIRFHDGFPADVLAQDGGDLDPHGHRRHASTVVFMPCSASGGVWFALRPQNAS